MTLVWDSPFRAGTNETWAVKSGSLFPIPGAVASGKQDGWVVSDAASEECGFLAVHKTGFCQLFGSSDDAEAAHNFLQALQSQDLPVDFPRYLLWYLAPKGAFPPKVSAQLSNFRLRRRIRWISSPNGSGPLSLTHTTLDSSQPEFAQALTGLTVVQPDRFWGSFSAFLANSMAQLTLIDGKPAAICYSAANFNGAAEVDIATIESAKRKGAGLCAALAFMEAARLVNRAPSWDCFESNEASVHLARKLSFQPILEYDFASFQIG